MPGGKKNAYGTNHTVAAIEYIQYASPVSNASAITFAVRSRNGAPESNVRTSVTSPGNDMNIGNPAVNDG